MVDLLEDAFCMNALAKTWREYEERLTKKEISIEY